MAYTDDTTQLTTDDYVRRSVRLLEEAQHVGWVSQGDDTRVAAAKVYAQLAATAQAAEQAKAEPQAPAADTEPEPETIRLTADVVVTTTDHHVLLIKRGWAPFEGMWALPGGHVDPGEEAAAAAARELAEEAGVYADPAELVRLGVWDSPGRDPRGRYVTVAYRLTVLPGTPIQAGDDATQAQWWPLTNLPPLAFDHAEIIRNRRWDAQ